MTVAGLRVALCRDGDLARRLRQRGAEVRIAGPAETFAALLAGDVEIGELSLSHLLRSAIAGTSDVVALPVVARCTDPTRMIYTRRHARPVGRPLRIGVAAFFQTTAAWLRALHPELRDATWVEGPIWHRGEPQPPGLSGADGGFAESDATPLIERFEGGDVDCLVAADSPPPDRCLPDDAELLGLAGAAPRPMHLLAAHRPWATQQGDILDAIVASLPRSTTAEIAETVAPLWAQLATESGPSTDPAGRTVVDAFGL